MEFFAAENPQWPTPRIRGVSHHGVFRNIKPKVVLLTTLICSRLATTDFSFLIYESNFNHLGACNIPLERYFQDLSNGILHALKFQKLQSQIQKNKTTVANPTDPWD